MAGRKKKTDLKDVLAKVKECLSLLPGEEDRLRFVQTISEIIKELQALQEGVQRFPDEAETRQVSHAVSTLVSFFETLKERPLLASALLPAKTTTRKAKVTAVDIEALQRRLESLPTENILEELLKHKKDVLVELSARLNVTASKSMTKDALADKIYKLGYANRRGYDLLGGRQNE